MDLRARVVAAVVACASLVVPASTADQAAAQATDPVASSVAPSPPGATDATAGAPGEVRTEGELPSGAPGPTAPAGVPDGSGTIVPGSAGDPTDPRQPVKPVDLPPFVHCAWVLPDMEPAADGHQYELGGLSDDLPDVPSPTPCALDVTTGVAAALPGDDPAASIRPNGGDAPGRRVVELWTAVSHALGPSAVDEVTFTVVRPDGTEQALGAADPATDAAASAAPLAAAVRSGQAEAAAAADLADMVTTGWVVMVSASLELSHLDLCGVHRLVATAHSGERSTSVEVPFDVVCFHQLVTDFDRVDWGSLVPDAESVLEGDTDPSTPARPTIANLGNVPMSLATTFQPLCLDADPAACFGRFGVELRPDGGAATRLDPREPGAELLDTAAAVCPGQRVRLDLLVRMPGEAPEGTYQGSMRAVGVRAADGACTVPPEAGEGPPPTTSAPPTTPPEPPATSAQPSSTTAPDVVASSTTLPPSTPRPRGADPNSTQGLPAP